MTRRDLIQAVAERAPHLSRQKTEAVIDTIFGAMAGALVQGERIEIRGFGSWAVRHYKARTGRNPKTGESVFVPSKRSVHFKAGKEATDRIMAGWRGESKT